MAEAYLGEIRMFGGNYAPAGWALCNGQILNIVQNQALFSILGATFGGNGTTTFGLPDLRGRVPIHQGQGQGTSSYTMGQSGGSETVPLQANQMPLHSHTVSAGNAAATATAASGNLLATVTPPRGQTQVPTVYGTDASATMNPAMIGSAGGGAPHPNVQPYQCVNFIIALQGIYPSRE